MRWKEEEEGIENEKLRLGFRERVGLLPVLSHEEVGRTGPRLAAVARKSFCIADADGGHQDEEKKKGQIFRVRD